MTATQVEIEVYKPRGDGSGYLDLVRRKTPNEVAAELGAGLKDIGLYDGFDYFGADIETRLGKTADEPTPRFARVLVYVVRGGSEGWYVHVEVLVRSGETAEHFPIATGKTFSKEHAWKAVRALADMLDW